MRQFGVSLVGLATFMLLFGLGVSAQDGGGGGAEAEGPLPRGPHVDLVYAKCQSCHNLRYVTDSSGLPPFLWEDTVDLMVQLGMQVTDEEKENLLEYLTVYLGPNPPPDNVEASTDDESTEPKPASESDASAPAEDLDGESLFSSNCAGCHQPNGQGVTGVFPPLVEHAPELYKAEGGRDYLATLMLHGLQGEIVVDGETYNGVMPAWTQLGDSELAAILNHILMAWGNEDLLPEGFTPYAAEDLAGKRDQGVSAREVLALRPALGGE